MALVLRGVKAIGNKVIHNGNNQGGPAITFETVGFDGLPSYVLALASARGAYGGHGSADARFDELFKSTNDVPPYFWTGITKTTYETCPNDLIYTFKAPSQGFIFATIAVQAENASSGLHSAEILNSCLYPNPVARGQEIKINAASASAALDGAVVEVYNALGARVGNQALSEVTALNAPDIGGVYIYRLRTKHGVLKSFRVIVK
jgi:hypothetical protein